MLTRRSFFLGATAAVATPVMARAAGEGFGTDDQLSVFVSDIHVGNPGIPTPYGAQPASPGEYFEKTVDEILALNPRPKRVVCFGDISLWFGFRKDYELSFRGFRRLKDAGIDLFFTMGNHDKRQSFGSVYPGYAERSPVPGRFVSVVDLGTCDLILLDSLNEGDPEEGKANPVDGTIDRAQWDWLESECMKRKRPFLCGSHHSPDELSLEIEGKRRDVLSFLRNAPFFRGWIHGHAHTWATEIMVKGWCDRTVFRKAVLPSTGHWGDIGYALMRTSSDRAELSLVEKEFFFPAALDPGEECPKQWSEIVAENRGRRCTFVY